jgi:hypothetical protein
MTYNSAKHLCSTTRYRALLHNDGTWFGPLRYRSHGTFQGYQIGRRPSSNTRGLGGSVDAHQNQISILDTLFDIRCEEEIRMTRSRGVAGCFCSLMNTIPGKMDYVK